MSELRNEAERASRDAERAPLFGRWAPWYALLVLELIAVIAFCGWLAAHRG